jgi:hypothetical protein
LSAHGGAPAALIIQINQSSRTEGNATYYLKVIFKVLSVVTNEPRSGRELLPELTMLLTENQAAERTCPLSMANPEGAQRCRASACQAWRYRSAPDANGFINPQRDASGGTATGYCGLVGGRPWESH